MASSVALLAEKLFGPTIKIACFGKVEQEEITQNIGISMAKAGTEVASRIAYWLVKEENASFTCRICYKKGFTRKGLYLHLRRVHKKEIRLMIEEELRAEAKKVI